MKTPIEQFFDKAKNIRLSDEANERIRSNLIAHMRANPVRIISPYMSVFSSVFSRPALALGVILLVAVGGATTYAASDSLPGDTFYPLKVNVIEPIKGFAVARSPEDRAKWQISLAEARVKEVERLAENESLTIEQSKDGKKRFDRSMENVRATLKNLSDDNPSVAIELEESFTASLVTHENNLHSFHNRASSTNAREAGEFAEHIRTNAFSLWTATSTRNDGSERKNNKDKKDKEDQESKNNKKDEVLQGVEAIATTTVSADAREESEDELRNKVEDTIRDTKDVLGL